MRKETDCAMKADPLLDNYSNSGSTSLLVEQCWVTWKPHTICSLLDHHRNSLSVWKPPSLEIEAHAIFIRATLPKISSLSHVFIYLGIKRWSVNMLLKHTMVIFSLRHFTLKYVIIWTCRNSPLHLLSILKNQNLDRKIKNWRNVFWNASLLHKF